MSNPIRASRSTVLLLVLFALTASCSDEGELLITPGTEITVTLRNQDTLPTHLFFNTETFPCCRVEPGESRIVTFEVAHPGGVMSFSAGRNGQPLVGGSATASLTQSQFDAKAVTRTWVGNGWTN
jgi:hypothetical protein